MTRSICCVIYKIKEGTAGRYPGLLATRKAKWHKASRGAAHRPHRGQGGVEVRRREQLLQQDDLCGSPSRLEISRSAIARFFATPAVQPPSAASSVSAVSRSNVGWTGVSGATAPSRSGKTARRTRYTVAEISAAPAKLTSTPPAMFASGPT